MIRTINLSAHLDRWSHPLDTHEARTSSACDFGNTDLRSVVRANALVDPMELTGYEMMMLSILGSQPLSDSEMAEEIGKLTMFRIYVSSIGV